MKIRRRIVKRNGRFYPQFQIRTFFIWGNWNNSGFKYNTLEEAINYISQVKEYYNENVVWKDY